VGPLVSAIPTTADGVFAVGSDGRLWQFYFNAQGNWEARDISTRAGASVLPIGSAVPVRTYTMNVFAPSTAGRLLQFYSNPQSNRWEVYDLHAFATYK
jgi:hypothetical protein